MRKDTFAILARWINFSLVVRALHLTAGGYCIQSQREIDYDDIVKMERISRQVRLRMAVMLAYDIGIQSLLLESEFAVLFLA